MIQQQFNELFFVKNNVINNCEIFYSQLRKKKTTPTFKKEITANKKKIFETYIYNTILKIKNN